MHICIPYGDVFVSNVCDYIGQYTPKTTIIHSTVPPLTTQTVIQKTKARVFHSPVVGIHPYLLEGLLTSTKYIGADTPCDDIVDHFKSLGVSTKVVSSKTSELAKLLSTSYYGLCIAWHGEWRREEGKRGQEAPVGLGRGAALADTAGTGGQIGTYRGMA